MAFVGAARSIKKGDSVRANIMFRRRLYAQSFTIVVMVLGSMYWKPERLRRKDFEKTIAEEKAKVKRDAWIRELEARDRDEKEWKAKQNRASYGKKSASESSSFDNIGSETEIIRGKLAQEKEPVGKGEGLVLKAVKELKDATKEVAEAMKDRIVPTEESIEAVEEAMGTTQDVEDIRNEK